MSPLESTAAIQAALEQRYLYGIGDYVVIALQLERLAALPGLADGERAMVLVAQGMTLHYQAIELSPAERTRIDVGPERSFFASALALCLPQRDDHAAAAAEFGLGLVDQVLLGDLPASAPHFAAAYDLLRQAEAVDTTLLGSEIVRHLGFDALLREGDFEQAIVWLQRSLHIREGLQELGWLASGHRALAFAYRGSGRADLALLHAQRALEAAESSGLRGNLIEAARTELTAARDGLARG